MATTQKFQDDEFTHLSSDIDKIRVRHRQYISYSSSEGAHSVVDEILNNSLDECRNPRSPGNKIHVEFDERDGFIKITDNGRGIPTTLIEEVFTSLNMGSNINTANKASLKSETLGQNGTGTLAVCALAERVEIYTFRGGTENKSKYLVFEEGKKVEEKDGSCSPDKHGLSIRYKPSKVLGKNTHIIWEDIHKELLDLQYLNQKHITIDSVYIDKKGKETIEKYKPAPFQDILLRNDKESMIGNIYSFTINADNIDEEIDGTNVKRFLSMDVAFVYTNSLTPYIRSFSNSNHTVDNGDHIDGAMEAICRYFQAATKNSLSDKEKERLDIKWDDVRNGLSVAVALRTNFERMYTGQTKHKVVNADLRRIIVQLVMDELGIYFGKNQARLKSVIDLVKTNARARREGDKVRTAVIKNTLTNWSSFKMKNFDPCTNKGKEYKELFIIEGDSAKGSLKMARDPKFQALFAIRGVSANVFKMTLDQIVGQNGNREFTNLTTVLGCNVGTKFNLDKLNYDKIIIASDADVDGLWIRSLMLAFFFKVFPEIVEDGRLYIAEPPLYRVDDRKNPFVINTTDYLNRYVQRASKEYHLGYKKDVNDTDIEWLDKNRWSDFLDQTKKYVNDISSLQKHYNKISDRLLEMVLEEFTISGFNIHSEDYTKELKKINIQRMMDRIGGEFKELYFDDKDGVIRGSVDAKHQEIEISESLARHAKGIIEVMSKWMAPIGGCMVLRNTKTNNEQSLSLLGTLKMLQKFQPNIEHRFKGLGENDAEDIKTTIMDPNTRMLIKVNIGDYQNDMAIFQMLRGGSQMDLVQRRALLKSYDINVEDIDT